MSNSICLLKLPFLASVSANFSTVCSDALSKCVDKPAQKISIFPNKAGDAKCLMPPLMPPKDRPVFILPAKGIGDALLMLIGAHSFLSQGYQVTTIHPKLLEVQNWFPDHHFATSLQMPPNGWILAENDNSPFIHHLKKEQRDSLSVFYPTYDPSKHGPLYPLDRAFSPDLTMAANIALASSSLLGIQSSKDNGIRPPKNLVHRKYLKRVLIHHTSSLSEKNWPLDRFDKLANRLHQEGFEPCFIPLFPTLSELFAFVYESGFVIGNDSLVGHLASNLQIPTVVIGDVAKRLQLWRPGWLEGAVVTPPPWLTYFHLCRKHWQKFISPRCVFQEFKKIFY